MSFKKGMLLLIALVLIFSSVSMSSALPVNRQISNMSSDNATVPSVQFCPNCGNDKYYCGDGQLMTAYKWGPWIQQSTTNCTEHMNCVIINYMRKGTATVYCPRCGPLYSYPVSENNSVHHAIKRTDRLGG